MSMKRNVVRGLGSPCESNLRKKLHELEMQEPDGPIEEEMRHIATVNNLIGASRGDLHGHLEAVREVRGMLLDKVSPWPSARDCWAPGRRTRSEALPRASDLTAASSKTR